ncbi:hypothetical protein [Actinomadura sp. 3N407]|uniref:hypothetical protein n=1 Tax=Actinomadura sp. 3N407 TaxID=3457423 RepID=UPI003FCDDFE8
MNQPSETNGPDEESPETVEDGHFTPAYVPASEVPTITVPRPESTTDNAADDTAGPSAAGAETAEASAVEPSTGAEFLATGEDESQGVPAEEQPAEPPAGAKPSPDPRADDRALDDLEPTSTSPADSDAPEDVPAHAPPEEPADAEPGSGLAAEDAEGPADDVPGDAAPPSEATGGTETVSDIPVGGGITLADEAEAEAEAEAQVGDDDEAAAGLDPRAAFETIPLEGVDEERDPTPPLGMEAAEDGWGGPELVEDVYGPLTGFYERLDERLREVPEDVPPVGWAPHIAALRALREERVTGDWEVLARFLVAPGSLEEGTEAVRLVQTDEGDTREGNRAVRDIVKELAAADGRALVVAPTPERAAELLRGVESDPEVFSLLIETRPATAEARSVETRAMPPVDEEAVGAPPVREPGSSGTVEFKPVAGRPDPKAEEGSSAVTRVEPLPVLPEGEPVVPEEGPSAPETRVRSAALRPVGEAWRHSWDTEARLMRRGLMWLEQWPRDAAALKSVQAEHLRRGEDLEAEQAALAGAIEESRNAAAAAEQAAEEAGAEAERLAAVQEEAEEELTGPRAEAERLQTVADEAAAEANALTRTADATYARCVQMDERAKTAQAELQAARQAEASLTDELAQARQALPGAAEEAHRLTAADADAAAEGHAAYYRLVSAESALSAVRRKMSFGQRLHVAAPPSEWKSLRAELKARTREADEAARRAREAKDAAENAERIRRGLASFVSEGGARLKAAQEAQERLGTELTWLAAQRETAGAEHGEQARLAAESVERATQAGMRARSAHQAAQEIEDRVNAARTSREQALAAAERARSDAETATARAAEAEAALERRTTEAAEETSRREADLETAQRTEARSRENVVEICGSDPAEDPEVVPAHQRRAMARIEQLTGYLDGGLAAGSEVLLRTADLVIGTPAGVGLTARDEEFDALIVADAGEVTDAEFLIGAVRARRWVLVGASGSRPPSYREYAGAPSGRPEDGPFGRAATAAPHLLGG